MPADSDDTAAPHDALLNCVYKPHPTLLLTVTSPQLVSISTEMLCVLVPVAAMSTWIGLDVSVYPVAGVIQLGKVQVKLVPEPDGTLYVAVVRPQIAVGPVMLATALLTVKVRAELTQVLFEVLVAVAVTVT